MRQPLMTGHRPSKPPGLGRLLGLTAAGLAAGFLTGCATPSASTAPVEKSAAPVQAGMPTTVFKLDRLKKGMAGPEIVSLWGQPAERRTMKTPAGAADVWVYHHVLRSNQRQVATSTHLVTVFDGLTNGTKETPEAVYSLEIVETIRNTELLIYKDRLLEWKVSEETVKRFN